MKALPLALPLLAASPAMAHPGHLAEVAGHGHWIAVIAVAGAALAALAGLRGRRKTRARSAKA